VLAEQLVEPVLPGPLLREVQHEAAACKAGESGGDADEWALIVPVPARACMPDVSVPAARVRSCAIAARASQAFAVSFPEGGWVVRSHYGRRMTCSIIADHRYRLWVTTAWKP
jgi:hypothetical protein